MDRTCFVFGILFVIAGVALALGMVHPHLTAWKEASEEEKASVRIDALCRNVGGMIVLCGVIWTVCGLIGELKSQFFIWLMILWFVLCGFDLYQIFKKGRYMV